MVEQKTEKKRLKRSLYVLLKETITQTNSDNFTYLGKAVKVVIEDMPKVTNWSYDISWKILKITNSNTGNKL